jgi:hypothetical protein
LNTLQIIKRRKATWIGHILRRNCILKHVIERKMDGSVEVTERRGRRCKRLLGYLNETRGCCKLKEEELDRTLGRTSVEMSVNLSQEAIRNEMIREIFCLKVNPCFHVICAY